MRSDEFDKIDVQAKNFTERMKIKHNNLQMFLIKHRYLRKENQRKKN
jgi:hypothetical protein